MEDCWILLVATLTAINCALLGTYLVLRNTVMTGDAISHAILPGMVIAYLWAGAKSSWIVILGSTIAGMIAVILIELLHKKIHLQTDAAIGINFTWLFALGIVLISYFGHRVDIDPECILYGEIAYTPIDRLILNGIDIGPRALYTLLIVLIINITFIALNYKELIVTTFDPDFAKTIGLRTDIYHYGLMVITALTVVAVFEIVGSILVVALLAAPPAAAYLLARRLSHMILLSILLGTLSAGLGYYLSVTVNGSIAGGIATMAGILFLVALCIYVIKKNKRCSGTKK